MKERRELLCFRWPMVRGWLEEWHLSEKDDKGRWHIVEKRYQEVA